MSWFSILPAQLSVYEVWAVRFFLFLATAAAGPWFLIVIYDFLYYVFRIISYEIPVVGGRARGRQRPRAPSLSERPDGSGRSLSLGRVGGVAGGGGGGREVREGDRERDREMAGGVDVGEGEGGKMMRRRVVVHGREDDGGGEAGEWDGKLRGRQI